MTTMWRTRLMIGLLSTSQGAGALIFAQGEGLAALVRLDAWGALFAWALIGFGLLMVVMAAAERRGIGHRWARELSSSMLGVAWLAVFYHSFTLAPATITIKAPIYILFCAWAWWAEADDARRRIIAARACEAA